MKLNLKKGFTLVELVVATAIFAILMVPIATMLFSMNNTFYSTSRYATSQAYANIAIETIKKELKDASNAALSHSLSAESTHKYIYVNNGVMVLRLVTTQIDEQEIIRKPDLDGSNLKCVLLFASASGKSVNVTIKIQDKTTSQDIYVLTTEVFLQNSPYGLTLGVTPGEQFEYFEYTEPNLG